MASITLTIPDPLVTRVIDAIASEYGYDPAKDGAKAQFAKIQLINFIKRTVRNYESSIAVKNAFQGVDDDVQNNILIS